MGFYCDPLVEFINDMYYTTMIIPNTTQTTRRRIHGLWSLGKDLGNDTIELETGIEEGRPSESGHRSQNTTSSS